MVCLSVVIPVYKAEKCLEELYERLTTSLRKITKDYEIVLVEDCGGDRSWEIINQLSRKDKRIKAIQFSRNFGQHCAITAGIDYCNGDWVVVMDCDLQDRPEEIPKLYSKAQEGYEVVVAHRGKRKDSYLKRYTSWLFYLVFNYFSGMNLNSEVGNFRIVSKKVVLAFREMRENFRFFSGMIDWMGYKKAFVDVQHEKSSRNKSTYTYRKLFDLAFDAILAYSDKPLYLMVKLGFGISLLSFSGGVYIIIRNTIKGSPVAGWGSLIVSLYFLGGILIGLLGLIGIYVGKTFNETKKRPLYIVRERLNV
jgi:polyisoprenyl-phosphate glycosyltransferase